MTNIVKVFSAKWCPSCGPYKESLDKAGIEYISLDADLDAHQDEFRKYNIRGLPTTVVVIQETGELVRQIVGSVPVSEVKKYVS